MLCRHQEIKIHRFNTNTFRSESYFLANSIIRKSKRVIGPRAGGYAVGRGYHLSTTETRATFPEGNPRHIRIHPPWWSGLIRLESCCRVGQGLVTYSHPSRQLVGIYSSKMVHSFFVLLGISTTVLVGWIDLNLSVVAAQRDNRIDNGVITSTHQIQILFRSEKSFVTQLSDFADRLEELTNSIRMYKCLFKNPNTVIFETKSRIKDSFFFRWIIIADIRIASKR